MEQPAGLRVRSESSRDRTLVSPSDYRTDVDGLRAVAIFLVVVYHVWADRVSGGVDVFLMISAFFLTRSFIKRSESDQRVRLGAFWARRFRRLLPAAAATIVGIFALGWLFFPQTSWPRIWSEGWASLFYAENWLLAANEVDYYARDEVLASPFQHFWSLSVQGQVFLIWPVILVVGAWLASRLRAPVTRIYAIAFGGVFVASFAFSVWETAAAQQLAYFDTRTRLWEFAAGSLVALALPHLRLGPLVLAVLGWLGLVAIVVCGFVIDVQGGFPGYLALWPVLATAFVIAADPKRTPFGPAILLSSPALRWIGRDAYALYLVHWPILITFLTITDRLQAGLKGGLLVIVASLVAARILTMAVERPLSRYPSPARGVRGHLGVILGCVVIVAVAVTPWQLATQAQAAATQEAAEQNASGAGVASQSYPGALAIDADGGVRDLPSEPILPAPTLLSDEWGSLDKLCEGALKPTDPELSESCSQTVGAENADRLIVVLGDSHSEQMMGAVVPLAEERGWGVVSLLKGGCSLGARDPVTDDREGNDGSKEASCREWRAKAVDHAIGLGPDAVYTIVTAAWPDSPDERALDGIVEAIDRFLAAGIDVWGVRDNPRYQDDMYVCAVENRNCDRPVESLLARENPAESLGAQITLVDFTPWLCPRDVCTAAIGNIAVYMDNNHLSWSYARTLAPALAAQIGDWASN